MAKASITIAIGGEYQGRDAVKKAEAELKSLREAARQAGGGSADIMRLGDSMVDLGTRMSDAGTRISDFGGKVTKMTAPIAAVGAASVKLASDYENSVAKVYTIMDKSVMSTEQMSKSILDLSTSTGKSATELAEATYQALSASVATDKVAGFVEDAVKLSKSGFTETSTAVDTLTTVINAYGYSAEDAEMISNRLIQTQNKGKTTVDELSQSMGNVIPTAAAYGVNLDNLCASYVTMTKQGINTANATTAINGMLTELADEGSDVNAIIQDLSGKTFGELMASGMSVADVLQILMDFCEGNTEEFANLWGNVRASKGALAIANAGVSEFNTALGDMKDSAGLVDAALEDLTTPMAKVNKATNALKNTGIQLGEEIIGAAVPSIEKLAEEAQEVYKWFSELDEGTKQNIVRYGALAVAIGPVVTMFGKAMSSVGGFLTRMGKGVQTMGVFANALKMSSATAVDGGNAVAGLGSRMKSAASSTGMLSKATSLLKGSVAMLGLAAAAAAVGFLVTKFMEWKEHTDTVAKATTGLETAMSAASAASADLSDSVDGATRSLADNKVSADEALQSQAQLADRMRQTWSDIGTDAAMVDRYAQTISELGEKGNLTKEEYTRLQAAVDGFNQLTGSSVEITNTLTGELNTSREAILGVAEAYKEEAKAAAAKEMLVELNKQQIQDEMALKTAKEELAKAEQDYQYQLENFPDSAWSYGQAVVSAQQKVDDLEGAISSAAKTEGDLLDIISQSPQRFSSMEQALSSCGLSVADLGNVSDRTLEEMRSSFDGTLASIAEACRQQGINIPDGLEQGINETKDRPVLAVDTVVQSMVNKAKSALESHSPSKVFERIGNDVDEGLRVGIDGNRPNVESTMASVVDSVKKAIANLPGDVQNVGDEAGSGMASGIDGRSGDVQNASVGLASGAEDGVSGTPSSFRSTGESAAWDFASAIGSGNAYADGQSLASSAENGLSSVSTYGAGQDFAWGFSNGMSGVDIWGAAYNVGVNALDAIKRALGIASPSKEAARVGEWFGEGAVVGMRRSESSIAAESRRMSELMGLDPEPFGALGYGGLPLRAAPGPAAMPVTMEVTVNVNATTPKQGAAVGTSLADAMFDELRRKGESRLWQASYTTA